MKCIVKCDKLINLLSYIISIVINRPVLPILCNLLISINKNLLIITSTNLEIEMIIKIPLLKNYSEGTITVPAKKFFNICRSLSKEITIEMINNQILISDINSKFFLSTLPSKDFPITKKISSIINFTISQETIKFLIEKTYFAIANQDVRHYLNGMFLKIKDNKITTVSTDGYRLATCTLKVEETVLPKCSIIIPKKSILELIRLLKNNIQKLKIKIDNYNISISNNEFIFKSKLIDGVFPEYKSVFPKNPKKNFLVNCDILKKALLRAAILANEQIYGIRFFISKNNLKITSSNIEQEKSEENIHIQYEGSTIEICLNVNYILDVLNILKCQNVIFLINNAKSSIQIVNTDNKNLKYIIMPMYL